MEHGVTGFICSTTDEAVEHLKNIDNLSRRACRAVFEQRFTVTAMAKGYLEVYERIADSDAHRRLVPFGRLRKELNVDHKDLELAVKEA